MFWATCNAIVIVVILILIILILILILIYFVVIRYAMRRSSLTWTCWYFATPTAGVFRGR